MAQNSRLSSIHTPYASSQSRLDPRTSASRQYTSKSRPRTAATSLGFDDEDNIICAVSESRGMPPSVGLSFVNLSTSEAVLCQFTDTQTFARTCHKISIFRPSQILYPAAAEDSKLILILRENLEVDKYRIRMKAVHRQYFSESSGHEYLQKLAFPADIESLKASVAGNFFAVCCFSAIQRYIEVEMSLKFAPETLRIKFEPSEGAMMIDLSTVKSLELVQNLRDSKSKDCLFGVVNQTLTKMGSRLLKSNVLQPSTDSYKIEQRYTAVEELIQKDEIFDAVRDSIKDFVDTDRALAAMVVEPTNTGMDSTEQSINNILMLKTFVDAIAPIFESLTGAASTELQKIAELCDPANYEEVVQLLTYAINQDVHYSRNPVDLYNQRIHTMRAGANGFLDVARQTYTETAKDAIELIKALEVDHEMHLEPGFDRERLYFVKIHAADLNNNSLPKDFINVVQNKKKIECQTIELVKLNQQIKNAHRDVLNLSDGSIRELINHIRSKIHPLFKISEAIALLDMLAGFAHLAISSEYIRPEITSTLAIKSGRHAIRERIQKTKFVPNDVYSDQQNRFQIITGCNMSGKSTYIRSVAIMVVMAQTGCFVPAEYASFPITNQLFARVSTDDNIEANVSTFSCEMREMAYILRNIEPQSLVIVDELGRGTSTRDGLSIAIAISEALIESRARVWFVTHFRDLPRIFSERAGVESHHMSVDITQDLSTIKMSYRLSEGQETQKFYGLALSQLVKLPAKVLETAAEVSKALYERNEAKKSSTKALAVARRRKLVLKLNENLLQARESNLNEDELLTLLRGLQEEFVVRMSAIDIEAKAEDSNPGLSPSKSDERMTEDADSVQTNPNNSLPFIQRSEVSDTSIATTQQITKPRPAERMSRSLARHGDELGDPILIADQSSVIDEGEEK